MTCVVGLVKDGRVYIGADSCGTAGTRKRTSPKSKVFVTGDFIFGVSGSVRVRDILQNHFIPPTNDSCKDDSKYLYCEFMPELIKCFKSNNVVKNLNGVDELENTCILMGYKGCLYTIFKDFQIYQSMDEFACMGSGENYANGTIKTLLEIDVDKDPFKLIEKSLEVSSYFCNTVAPPFVIESI